MNKKVGFRLNYDKPFFLTEKEVKWRTTRLIIGFIMTLLTMSFVFLVAIAFPAKVANSNFYWTLRAPLASGLPKANDYVLASDTLGGIRTNTRIVESLFRTHSIVKIIAVPGDQLSYDGTSLNINGTNTSYKADIKSGSRLSAQYLVLCKEGKCHKDKVYTIPSTNVLGTVNWDEEAERERLLKDPNYANATE